MTDKNRKIYIVIALVAVAFIAILLVKNRIDKKNESVNCKTGILYTENLELEGYDPRNINKAKVYSLNRKTGKIVDSTFIAVSGYDELRNQYSASSYYSFNKPLSTSTDWKIILCNRHEILISDIITDMNEYQTMFSTMKICEITEWKVNGKAYNRNDYYFVLKKR